MESKYKMEGEYIMEEDDIFKLKDLTLKGDKYIDTINNKNYDIKIEAKSIDKFNSNKEKFYNEINSHDSFVFTKNDHLIQDLVKYCKNAKIEKNILNHGFVYNNIYYFLKTIISHHHLPYFVILIISKIL